MKLPKQAKPIVRYTSPIEMRENKWLLKGDQAPDFELKDHTGREVRLSDYRGVRVVLWFYPRAGTPSLINQGIGFRDRIHQFEAQGVQILGVSTDSVEDNAAFASKYNLPFPLLSDTGRQICMDYRACDSPSDRAQRITYVIGQNGKIFEVYQVKESDVSTHTETILASVERLASQDEGE